MITVTYDSVRETILAAHATGALTAQAPRPRASYYDEQEGRTYRCAVGQLLPIEVARGLENQPEGYMYARELVKEGVITGVDAERLQNIQALHDRWVAAFGEDRAARETTFLAAVREFGR